MGRLTRRSEVVGCGACMRDVVVDRCVGAQHRAGILGAICGCVGGRQLVLSTCGARLVFWAVLEI